MYIYIYIKYIIWQKVSLQDKQYKQNIRKNAWKNVEIECEF